MRILLWLLASIVFAYAGLCIGLFIFQRSLVYYPQPGTMTGTANTMKLSVQDAELQVSIRAQNGPKALIYFGGNAEDVSLNLPDFSQAFPDYAIYLLHYRSYGGSTGTPTEEALQKDAQTLFDQVHLTHPEIVVLGRSLGSGVAVRLASQRPVSRLILITPYDSIQAVAAQQFPYIPVSWILRDKFESWRYAPAIHVPTLLVAAEHDELIPMISTERLRASFRPGVASLKIIKGTGHNTISNSSQYLESLRTAL